MCKQHLHAPVENIVKLGLDKVGKDTSPVDGRMVEAHKAWEDPAEVDQLVGTIMELYMQLRVVVVVAPTTATTEILVAVVMAAA
jgi:hypothetical protein